MRLLSTEGDVTVIELDQGEALSDVPASLGIKIPHGSCCRFFVCPSTRVVIHPDEMPAEEVTRAVTACAFTLSEAQTTRRR
jgi:hypothetical protein